MSLKKRDHLGDGKIHLAILDTGFCPQKLNTTNESIIITEVKNFAGGFETPCQRKTLLGRRYHGHYVLEQFLSSLKTKQKIVIHPMIIFNQKGNQQLSYWKRALREIKELNIDYVLAAAGFPLKEDSKVPALPKRPLFFLAAGKVGPGISEKAILFPQNNSSLPNVLLIGNYYPPTKNDSRKILDSSMLNLKKTHYFFSGGTIDDQVRGTSRATAIALGRALSLCPHNKSGILSCLDKKAKSEVAVYQDGSLTIKTY